MIQKEFSNTPESSSEPVALVGMACRFPGAPDLGRFWDLLRQGKSAIREAPAHFWRPWVHQSTAVIALPVVVTAARVA